MSNSLKICKLCLMLLALSCLLCGSLVAQTQSSKAHARMDANKSQNPAPNPADTPTDNDRASANGMPTIDLPQITSVPVSQIGPGDLLEISVYGAPDIERRDFRVDEKGDISVPLIGPQRVAGLSTTEAEALIAKKMADGEYYNDPHVSVLIKQFATQGVSVMGEVTRPGVYPLLGSRRLFDVISLAGGLTPKAGKTVSIMHREHREAPETISISGDSTTSLESDVVLQSGDTVVISKAGIVYVVGDVKLPGGFSMENGKMTILQALAMAQGANPTAALGHSKLIRSTPQGHEDVPISLKEILSGKASDVSLQAEDIVFVPNSAGKSVGRRTLEAIAQAAALAVYRF
jgi:polysaccharide export outer membrane protein